MFRYKMREQTGLIFIKFCSSGFRMASAPSSCHLEATLTNLHQTFHSKPLSLECCSIFFLCPHLAETFLTLHVTYFCLFPRSLFLAHCLGHTINALLSSRSSPSSKGFAFQGETLSSETLFPATAVIQAVSGYIQGRLKGCGFSRKILANFCARKHSAVVLKLTKARRSEEGGKHCGCGQGSQEEGRWPGHVSNQ